MAAFALSAVAAGSLVAPPSFSAKPRAGVRSGRSAVVSCCQSSSTSVAAAAEENRWALSRRDVVAGSVSAISALFCLPALALLETDDDESLLEKVKEDRQKRIQKRGAISSFKTETESVQKAVYQLSKAGQAIDGEDLGLANSVLGTTDVSWITDIKAAFVKVSKNAEEVGEAANFTAALQSLQSAVSDKDLELSRSAFVASASALEKWSSLTGFSEQIKGL